MSAQIDDSINQIIQLALQEIDDPVDPDGTASSDAAEQLSDELCTLCIEFGIEFNDFALAVMSEVLDPSHSDPKSESASPRFPKLRQFPQHRSLLLFALEFMPD